MTESSPSDETRPSAESGPSAGSRAGAETPRSGPAKPGAARIREFQLFDVTGAR